MGASGIKEVRRLLMVWQRNPGGRTVGFGGLLVLGIVCCGVVSSSGRLGEMSALPGDGVVSSSDELAGTYALPSDGWTNGLAMTALAIGPFHAGRIDGRVCAWLGDTPGAFLWPAGYRVRLAPSVALITPTGEVVVVGGEHIGAGGGSVPAAPGTPCTGDHQDVFLVEGSLEVPKSSG
jgi:hypothetical protein